MTGRAPPPEPDRECQRGHRAWRLQRRRHRGGGWQFEWHCGECRRQTARRRWREKRAAGLVEKTVTIATWRHRPPLWLPPSDVATPCATTDPDLWISDNPRERQVAAAACAACPVVQACRDAGQTNRETGVWGGWDLIEGETREEGVSHG